MVTQSINIHETNLYQAAMGIVNFSQFINSVYNNIHYAEARYMLGTRHRYVFMTGATGGLLNTPN